MPPDEMSDYVCARVEHALAVDERTAELGLTVTETDGELVVSGSVATPDRRDAVTLVASEAAHGQPVRNEVDVVELPAPSQVEPL